MNIAYPDFWVYILLCNNNNFYTGYTNNLIKRYRTHVKGRGAKYTKYNKPVCLLQAWPIYGSKSTAMKIELFIKKLKRSQKDRIILFPFEINLNFYPKSGDA